MVMLAGDAGENWLEQLPSLVKFYEKKWQIKCLNPFSLSYNYVLPVETADGKLAVLKISFPNNSEFDNELETLRFYNGVGSVKVLQEDRENQVILLERAMPGMRIGDVQPDRKQISLVSEVIKKIHQPILLQNNYQFPTLTDWAKVFERYRQNFDVKSGPIPAGMFEEAEEIFAQHSTNNESSFLLHGDLHNDNIILSERGWLVIDPKGVVGNQEFEVGTYLRNPLTDLPEGSNYKLIEKNRISQFSEELGLDKKSLLQWTLANAVISLLWFLEDEKEFKKIYLHNAELISEIQF